MSAKNTQQDPSLDRATPEDAAHAARAREKDSLLDELATLETRKESLEGLIEDKKARLQLLMSEDGDTKRMNESGSAAYSERRVFAVINAGLLAKRAIAGSKKNGPITVETLAEGFRPTAAFVDGAAQEGVDITDVISVGIDESFSFKRPQTAAAKKQRDLIIEQTKTEAASAAAEVARKMRERRTTQRPKESGN